MLYNKVFKIITQQLKSNSKTYFSGGLTVSMLVFYYNSSVFIICKDALLKSRVHTHKVFNKKIRKYTEE